MARVRLELIRVGRQPDFRFVRPGGVPDALPAFRDRVYVNLSADVVQSWDSVQAAYPDCVLNTGAQLTIIPERSWRHLKHGVVTPLPFDPATPLHRRVLTVAGGRYPFDLGEITLRLQDRSGGRLDATVVAMFTRDGGTLNVPPRSDCAAGSSTVASSTPNRTRPRRTTSRGRSLTRDRDRF